MSKQTQSLILGDDETLRINDSAVSNELKQEIMEISQSIQLDNFNQILSYGATIQDKISIISKKMIENTKTKDMVEISSFLTELVKTTKNPYHEIEQKNSHWNKVPIIGDMFLKLRNKIQETIINETTIYGNFENIENSIDEKIQKVMKNNEILEELYSATQEEYLSLQKHIAAGLIKIQEETNVTLKELEKIAQETQELEDFTKYMDKKKLIDRFQKKIYNLNISKTMAIHQGQEIREKQNNNSILIEELYNTKTNTIPLWERQTALLANEIDVNYALEMKKAIRDFTNKTLSANSELLMKNTIETAKQTQEDFVDINIIEKSFKNLLQSQQKVKEIEQKGTLNRQKNMQELEKLEQNLKQNLLDLKQDIKLLKYSTTPS